MKVIQKTTLDIQTHVQCNIVEALEIEMVKEVVDDEIPE